MAFQEFNSLFTRKQIEKILFYEIRFNLLLKLLPFLSKHNDDDMSVNYFDSFSKNNDVLYKNKQNQDDSLSLDELVENDVYSSYQEAMSQKSAEINKILHNDELLVDFIDKHFLIIQQPNLEILRKQLAKREKEQKESLMQSIKEEHIKEMNQVIKAYQKNIELFKNNSIRWFLKYLQKTALKIDPGLKKDLLRVFYLSFDIILDDFMTGNYILKNNITLIDDYVFSKYQHDKALSSNFSKLMEVAQIKRFSDNIKENLLTYYVLIEELNFEIMFLLKDFYNYLLAIKNNNLEVINQYLYIIEDGQLGLYVSGLEAQMNRNLQKVEQSQTYAQPENLETVIQSQQNFH